MKRFINYKTGLIALLLSGAAFKVIDSTFNAQLDISGLASRALTISNEKVTTQLTSALAAEEESEEPREEEKPREPVDLEKIGVPDPNKKPEDFLAENLEVCETSEALLQVVEDERRNLKIRKREVQEEITKLELAKARIQLELDNLQSVRDEVAGLLKRSEALFTDDVQRLINLYKNMKPKEAAALMNNMDTELAVLVLGKMPERNAAPILAKMSPVVAQAISKIILERSKLPGDQRLNSIKLR